MWYVYIIKSANKKWFYVGSTNRLIERLHEHNNRTVRSTKAYAPFDLVYKVEFSNEKDARLYEKKLKECRIEKERIIKNL